MKKYTAERRRINEDKFMIEEDSYWTHDILHPNFWFDNTLDPNIREKLLEIANNFYENTGFDAEIKDIQLTGSIANYNYHPLSDLDVHILIDFADINPSDPSLGIQAANGKRWIWNKQHEIFIRGNEVEMYLQQYDEPHTASGLYSLSNDNWVVEPEMKDPQTDPADVDKKAQAFKDEIDQLEKELDEIHTNDEAKELANRLAGLRSKIMRMRKDAFAAGKDEFSVENLAFKELRNTSYMGKVIELAALAFDKMFAEPVKEGTKDLRVVSVVSVGGPERFEIFDKDARSLKDENGKVLRFGSKGEADTYLDDYNKKNIKESGDDDKFNDIVGSTITPRHKTAPTLYHGNYAIPKGTEFEVVKYKKGDNNMFLTLKNGEGEEIELGWKDYKQFWRDWKTS